MKLLLLPAAMLAAAHFARRGWDASPQSRQLGEPSAPKPPTPVPRPLQLGPRLRSALSLRERRRQRAFADQLPVLLEAVARSLRSGLSIEAGLREGADQLDPAVRVHFDELNRRIGLGEPLAFALTWWRHQVGVAGADLAAEALSLGDVTGGDRARAVDAVAVTLRERAALRSEVVSLGTQARASAWVMAATPLVFLALVTLTGGDAVPFLVGTRFGLTCLAAGICLEAVGGAWMVWLTRAAL